MACKRFVLFYGDRVLKVPCDVDIEDANNEFKLTVDRHTKTFTEWLVDEKGAHAIQCERWPK